MQTTIIQVIIYGLIQGLTEFIPVSSSGHLFIIPAILGWKEPSTTLTLFLHVGTLIALVIYFRHRIASFIYALIALIKKQDLSNKQVQNLHLLKLVAISAVPTLILGILLDGYVSQFYDANEVKALPTFITLMAMIFVGILFVLSPRFLKGKEVDFKKYSNFKAVIIGVSQALAFVRGVSRSGITLLVGQGLGLSRAQAAEYSFLLSIPILLATSLKSTYDLITQPQTDFNLGIGLIGVVVAGVSGYIAVSFLIGYLKNNTLSIFGWYRIIFGILALLILFS